MCQNDVPPYEQLSPKMKLLHDRLWDRFRHIDGDRVRLVRAALQEAILIFEPKPTISEQYDKDFGDDKLCKCGHPYHRHFDSYEDMEPTGCKYCKCLSFREKKAQ